MKRVFISDCEGPISKNDNAFEVTSHFVPEGDRLFTAISTYDDVLADVLKRPGHNAGNTLKLILPFLKAYNATDEQMIRFASRTLALMTNAGASLRHIRKAAPCYIVSTSYEHYMRALCQVLDFPFKNTYCTQVRLDKYSVTREEKTRLKRFGQEIAQMASSEIIAGADGPHGLTEKAQTMIGRLDEIFWRDIADMQVGKIYSEVNPVGGGEKAEAVKDIVSRLHITLPNVMYVGDSITDEQAFKLVKAGGGLAVSFNGNEYAVENAEVALMSEDSMATAVVADVFVRLGKTEALRLVEDWSRKTLAKTPVAPSLLNRFFQLHPCELPKARIITKENVEDLAKESNELRKRIRGKAIGRLG